MPETSERRFHTQRIAKFLSVILAVLVFGVVSVSIVSGILLRQILRPARTPAAFDLSIMMGHPVTFSFSLPNGASREGWYFPGQRGAPAVIVSHGYLSQRADVLTLVTALQDHQFNVFLFDFTGHGTSAGSTTLGYRETGELRSAVQALAARDDVDPQHLGLWGVDMGGYASLEVAATDRRIAAVAVDNAYDDPRSKLAMEVKRSGFASLPFVVRACDLGFRWLNPAFRHEPPVSARLARTQGIPKLFVESDDQPALANETFRLFTQAPEPKQMVRERLSYRDMSDEDRKTYENQIVNFFLLTLPFGTGASR